MPKTAKQRADNLRYYHRNRDKNIAWQRAYRKKMKDICFAAYGGYRCNCCDETEPTMLALDHINNDGYKHRKIMGTRGGLAMHLWIIRNNFPPIFQVLCYNCNQSKRLNGGVCAHKGVNTMAEMSRPEHQIFEHPRPQGHGHLDQKLDKGMRSPVTPQLPHGTGLEMPQTPNTDGGY